MKELEWSQHYSLIFWRSRAANSEVSDLILPEFKLIQAFIVVLIVCKNEEDSFKNEGTRVVTTFSHYKSMGIFPDAQGQVTHKSLVGSCRILNQFEILCLSLLPARIKKNKSKKTELEWSKIFPIITLWELSVAMETRVLIRSYPKPNAVNPPPQWCTWWNLIMIGQLVSEIFTFESVDGQTHARTDGRRLWWAKNLILSFLPSIHSSRCNIGFLIQ